MRTPTCRCYEMQGVFLMRDGEITHDKGNLCVCMEYPDGTIVQVADNAHINYCPNCGAPYEESEEGK